MPFRSRRRRRSATYPGDEDMSRRFVIHLDVNLPEHVDEEKEQKTLVDWAGKFLETEMRIPSTGEMKKYALKSYVYDLPYDSWEKELTLIIPCSKQEQELWVMGESMDAYADYRNPDPKPVLKRNMYLHTQSDKECLICLGTVQDEKIAIGPCFCIYHKKCIETSYGYSNKCPICEEPITELESIIDYDDIVMEIVV